jgi:hypothetical protein
MTETLENVRTIRFVLFGDRVREAHEDRLSSLTGNE